MGTRRHDEIMAYVISDEFLAMVRHSRNDEYHAAYWKLIERFGRDGVHYLERSRILHPALGAKVEAAEAVAREWRDQLQEGQQRLLVGVAILSMIASIVSAITAFIAVSGQ